MVEMNDIFPMALLIVAALHTVNAQLNTKTDEESARVLVFWNGGIIKVPQFLHYLEKMATLVSCLSGELVKKEKFQITQQNQMHQNEQNFYYLLQNEFIVGWSIPVPNHTPFVTLFTHQLQMAYPTINNATQLHDFLQEGIAKGVRYTKRSVYFLLDRFLSRYGNINRQCLTRFICELSQISIGHQFTADILTYIFRPDDKGKYEKAWNRGRVSEDCEKFYHCPFVQGLLSHFTTVQYL